MNPKLPEAGNPNLLVSLRTGKPPLPDTPHNPRLIQRVVTSRGIVVTRDDLTNLAVGYALGIVLAIFVFALRNC